MSGKKEGLLTRLKNKSKINKENKDSQLGIK